MREREKRRTFVGDGGAEEGGHAVANAFDLMHFKVRRGDGVLEGEREDQNGERNPCRKTDRKIERKRSLLGYA